MNQRKTIWAVMIGTAVVGLTACGIDMPKEVNVVPAFFIVFQKLHERFQGVPQVTSEK